jgi:hypothetical protein
MKTQDVLKLAICLNWQNHCTYPYSKFSFGDTPMHNNPVWKVFMLLGYVYFKFSKGFQNQGVVWINWMNILPFFSHHTLCFFIRWQLLWWSLQVCHHLMWNLFWDAHHFGSLRKLKTKWLPWIHVVIDHHCLNMNILNTQMHVSYRLVWDYCLFLFVLKTHPLPFHPKHAGSYTNWPDKCIPRGFEYSCSYIPNVQI